MTGNTIQNDKMTFWQRTTGAVITPEKADFYFSDKDGVRTWRCDVTYLYEKGLECRRDVKHLVGECDPVEGWLWVSSEGNWRVTVVSDFAEREWAKYMAELTLA